MIPPGVHFIHTIAQRPVRQQEQPSSDPGDGKGVALSHGEFVWFEEAEVIVRTWDEDLEHLTEHSDLDQIQRLTLGVQRMDFDDGLAAYPLQSYQDWQMLSSFITPGLLEKLTRPPREEKEEKEETDGDLAVPSVIYSKIPPVSIPEGASHSEITRLQMDRTAVLEKLLRHEYSGSNDANETWLLGEMQHAFVSFVVGESLAGLEQWKGIVHLLCSCESAVEGRPSLYRGFLETLHGQFLHIPADFFHDALSGPHNFLRPSLRDLFEILADSEVPKEVREQEHALRSLLLRRFQWDPVAFEPEDEDGPTIVELE